MDVLVVVIDAELNSASNGVLFKGGRGPYLSTMGENTG
jgi:hypothetical protein